MNTQQQINIKIDSDLKRDMDNITGELGLTTTDALRVFMKHFVARRGFPFPVEVLVPYMPKYNHETFAALDDAIAGKGFSKTSLTEIEAVWDDAK